jgi:hypothetical protein
MITCAPRVAKYSSNATASAVDTASVSPLTVRCPTTRCGASCVSALEVGNERSCIPIKRLPATERSSLWLYKPCEIGLGRWGRRTWTADETYCGLAAWECVTRHLKTLSERVRRPH